MAVDYTNRYSAERSKCLIFTAFYILTQQSWRSFSMTISSSISTSLLQPLVADKRQRHHLPLANQYSQRYHFHVVTSHSLFKRCSVILPTAHKKGPWRRVAPELPVNWNVAPCPSPHPHRAGTWRQAHEMQPNGFKNWQVPLRLLSQTKKWSQTKS